MGSDQWFLFENVLLLLELRQGLSVTVFNLKTQLDVNVVIYLPVQAIYSSVQIHMVTCAPCD